MLESMIRLGRALREASPNLEVEQLVQPARATSDARYVAELNIDTEKGRIEVRSYAFDESQSPQQFLWIGNADGANSPQWLATTDHLEYLLSQTIPSLCKELERAEREEHLGYTEPPLYTKLVRIRDAWIRKAPSPAGRDTSTDEASPQAPTARSSNKGQAERYLQVLNLAEFDILTESQMQACWYDEKGREIQPKGYPQQLAKACLKVWDLKEKEVALWTLAVDGQRVVESPVYRELVAFKKLRRAFEGNRGICKGCGQLTEITDDLGNMKFKYYNTDKISFASGLDQRRWKENMNLCRSCYAAELAAEAYVQKYLRSKIGDLPFYVIPDVLGAAYVDPREIEEWSKGIRTSVETLVNFQGLQKFEENLGAEMQESGAFSYVVNLLFFRRSKAEMRILGLIRDVPFTRIKQLNRAFNEANENALQLLGPVGKNGMWCIDLNTFYYLIPLDKQQGDVVYRNFLRYVDALLQDKKLPYDSLLNSFVQLIRVYRFGQFGKFQIRPPRSGYELFALEMAVLQANVLFGLFRRLGQLQGDSFLPWEESTVAGTLGDELFDPSVPVIEQSKRIVAAFGYNEIQQGLFWLGYLVGDVALAQYHNSLTNYPILEKINYHGMDKLAVQRLSNEVAEALQRYKRIGRVNEPLFEMMRCLNPYFGAKRWPLRDEEATFYVISGFAVFQQLIRTRQGKQALEEPTQPVEA